MSLFSEFVSLFTSIVKPAQPAYTTIVYPIQGKAVVVHDGLGIRHEQRWKRFDSLLAEDEPSTSFSIPYEAPTTLTESVELFHADSFTSDFLAGSFEPMGANRVNPANGMPMRDSSFDVMGNAYGMDTMSNFGGSFSAFGFD